MAVPPGVQAFAVVVAIIVPACGWASATSTDYQGRLPPLGRDEVAVVLFVDREMSGDLAALQSFQETFNDGHGYDIVVFHSIAMNGATRSLFTGAVRYGKVSFHEVRVEAIDYKKVGKKLDVPQSVDGFHPDLSTIQQRKRYRFFSGLIWDHAALQKYKYVWRLDTGSIYICPIRDNPVEWMYQNGKVYAWNMVNYEIPTAAGDTLWQATMEFMAQHRIYSSHDMAPLQTVTGNYARCHYRTDFEIVSMDWIRRQDGHGPQSYFDYLDRRGGFALHRWSDAMVRMLSVAMFAKPEEVVQLDSINYRNHFFCMYSPECRDMVFDRAAEKDWHQCENNLWEHGGVVPQCSSRLEVAFRGIDKDDPVHQVIAVTLTTALVMLGLYCAFFRCCCFAKATPKSKKIQDQGTHEPNPFHDDELNDRDRPPQHRRNEGKGPHQRHLPQHHSTAAP